MANEPVLVLGAGAWGTALACVLADGGRPVWLWGRDEAQRRELRHVRENRRYLPDIPLPASIEILDEISALPAACRWAVLATPCQSTRSMARYLRDAAPQVEGVVCAAKGLEVGSRQLVQAVAAAELGPGVAVALLSGPTFAREVAEGRPAAVTIGAADAAFGRALVARFHTARFRPYLSTDPIGVAVGGSVKNVLAIAAGVADGLQLGANSRAALITRGLAEVARFGVALGAQRETFMGLSGLGDLVLTCTDDQSRNRRLGLALGAGETKTDAEARIGLVEGASSAGAVAAEATRLGVEMPIVGEVAALLAEVRGPREVVERLMAREPGTETDA